MALKVLAWFMMNDRTDLIQANTNTLEKVGHQYHMQEIYKAAGPIYQELKKNPPQDDELCDCVNDVERNGIVKELRSIAHKLKNFGGRNSRERNEPEPQPNERKVHCNPDPNHQPTYETLQRGNRISETSEESHHSRERRSSTTSKKNRKWNNMRRNTW